MSKLIKVKDLSGRQTWINPDHIVTAKMFNDYVRVYPTGEESIDLSHDEWAYIDMNYTSDAPAPAPQSEDDVMSMISEAGEDGLYMFFENPSFPIAKRLEQKGRVTIDPRSMGGWLKVAPVSTPVVHVTHLQTSYRLPDEIETAYKQYEAVRDDDTSTPEQIDAAMKEVLFRVNVNIIPF
jgi:hypothetical protein